MTHFRLSNIATAFCFVFLCLPFAAGQNIPTTLPTENTSESELVEPLTIKLSVEEVRLDVVVLDNKGNQITDLTADDFEVYQDGKRQKVFAGVYIDHQSGVAAAGGVSRKDSRNLPLLPSVEPNREDVGRTIVFLLDDCSMNFADGYHAKMALRNFVEKQMLPGDMVSIFQTGYGNSRLQMFRSDKRQLLAHINAMRLERIMGEHPSRIPEEPTINTINQRAPLYDRINGTLTGYLEKRSIEYMPKLISYSFRTLKDMPGRKYLIIVGPPTLDVLENRLNYGSYGDNINRLADEALRAGVVVNHLDIGGLYNFLLPDIDSGLLMSHLPPLRPMPGLPITPGVNTQTLMSLALPRKKPSELPLNPLPDKTGGKLIMDSNFFLDGIGTETENLMKGYYLVSYEPPADTFKPDGKENYHRVKVSVKRRGASVHTREGFFNHTEIETGDDNPRNPLIEAIYSPFRSTDLNVNITAGYVKDAKAGYLVRAWIHLDPQDVKIIETENGGARIDLEAVYVASDITDNIEDSKRVEFTLSKFNPDWVRKHGIRFSMLLPVKKPGPYYIRISIQDRETGKIGSAYQFLEIPDVGRRGPVWSDIFIISSADDLVWMNSDVTEETADEVFFPVFQGEDVRSSALRTYKPGDNLITLAMLYNADARAVSRSEIETQTILYKDGAEFLRVNPSPVASEQADDTGGIPILNVLTVGANMPPGDYVLRLIVTDKKNGRNNEGAASKMLGFTVVEE